jgi:hypothetical protein
MDKIFALCGMIASFVAAVLWLWASMIEVPDNPDTIIAELQRIGRINAAAAMAALFAAICAAYGFWRQLG